MFSRFSAPASHIRAIVGAIAIATLGMASAHADVVPTSDITLLGSYTANNKFFAPGFPSRFEFGGANEITIANQPGSFLEFCLEFFVGGGGDSITTSPGLGASALTAQQTTLVQTLLSNTVPGFYQLLDPFLAAGGFGNAAQADAGERVLGYSSGMQIAIWEIIEDTGLSTSNGGFGLFHDRFPVGSSSNYATLYADEFLGHMSDNSWSDKGGLSYTFAESGDFQDHVLVQRAAAGGDVPEPSSLALVGLGLFALRRKMRAFR